MNKHAIAQVHLLEQSISDIVKQSNRVASLVDTDPELIDQLQQTAIALLYFIRALESQVSIRIGTKKPSEKGERDQVNDVDKK